MAKDKKLVKKISHHVMKISHSGIQTLCEKHSYVIIQA